MRYHYGYGVGHTYSHGTLRQHTWATTRLHLNVPDGFGEPHVVASASVPAVPDDSDIEAPAGPALSDPNGYVDTQGDDQPGEEQMVYPPSEASDLELDGEGEEESGDELS
jgi:hypothetical protein